MSSISLEDDIQDFLADDVQTLYQRRSAATSRRMISYATIPSPTEAAIGFNISMDISGCKRGVRKNTTAGIYTYSNGTTQENTTIGDILADLKAIKREAPDSHAADRLVWDHTLTSARTVRDMGNLLLDGGLVCKMAKPSGQSVHNELRRLLWLDAHPHAREEAKQISILIATSGLAGLVAGGVTALAAFIVEYRNTHGEERKDKTLTKEEVRNEYIIVGIATFVATLAAEIVSDIEARRRRHRVDGAISAEVFLAMTRAALETINAQQVRAAAYPITVCMR